MWINTLDHIARKQLRWCSLYNSTFLILAAVCFILNHFSHDVVEPCQINYLVLNQTTCQTLTKINNGYFCDSARLPVDYYRDCEINYRYQLLDYNCSYVEYKLTWHKSICHWNNKVYFINAKAAKTFYDSFTYNKCSWNNLAIEHCMVNSFDGLATFYLIFGILLIVLYLIVMSVMIIIIKQHSNRRNEDMRIFND